jgi:serine/threonine protein kinase
MLENDLDAITDISTTDGTFKLDGPPQLPSCDPPKKKVPISQLGPYEIQREIGRGAMGTVYEAVHSQLQRTVALKVLPPELAESEKRLQRFKREMAAIGRLEHPNIVLATDAGESDGLCYIAMQFIDGRDLEVILSEIGRFEPADACEIVRQAALGLQHIHEQRLVHRDIKPSNIVMTKRGEIKILDLGIAMLRNIGDRETAMTAAGSLMGTPDYIAPEQITQCFDVDIRADIYSLGCTLYGLLSGKPPFTGPGYTTYTAKLLGHSDRQPPALGELCPEIEKPLVQCVERMMAKKPDDRPALPSDVAELMSEYCEHHDLIPIATGQMRKPPKPAASVEDAEHPRSQSNSTADTRRTKLYAGETIASCLVVAITAWMMFGSSSGPRQEETRVSETAAPAASMPAAMPAQRDVPPTIEDAMQRSVISGAVEKIAESNETIADNTTEIVYTLDQLRQQFEEATAAGSSVRNPKTPADHYFNARVHSQRGDYIKARQSFLAYFSDELPVVDPHLQFIHILKLQEGVAGARELYRELPGDKEVPARRLAQAMLYPAERRTQLLTELVESESEYAPAWYQLSREYSLERKPVQTLSDQVREKQLLERFLDLHERGQLLKHFLDQSKAATMLEDAQQRINTLASVDVSSLEQPVRITQATPSSGGWSVSFGIAEAAVEILYRVGEQGEFKSTGNRNVFIGGAEPTDPRTGKPFPKCNIDLPETPKTTIYVKYVDAASQFRGPYSLEFDPYVLRGNWERFILDANKRQWLVLRDGTLLFSIFNYGRDQVKAVVYGLDEETPTREKSVPSGAVGETNYQEFMMSVSPTVKFATIQVTFTDGSKSEVIKIMRTQ